MQKLPKKRRRKLLPFQETLESKSYSIFGRYAPYFQKKIFHFKVPLEKARMKIYSDTYVAMMLFLATITIPISAVSIVLAALFGFLPILVLAPLPLFVILAFILAPMSKASSISADLEREMPFAAAYISVMASGGIAPYNSFKRISEVALMPSMSVEAKEITKEVEIFGVDPLSAIENASKKTSLSTLKDFLGGYASTVIIGGDIAHYLERKAEDTFKNRALRVKAAAERLGMLLETFIIVMVMMSLAFYILFAVSEIQPSAGAGSSAITSVLLYTFMVTPVLSLVFIYLAHSMQPKTPIVEKRPYKVFGLCSAIGIALFAAFTFTSLNAIIDMPTAITIALFVATFPAALIDIKLSKHKASMEAGIANFLRDLTEVRKTGLSPEKCIESLSKREYGTFTKELNKISSDISWGIPIKKVMSDFLNRTRSWMSQIVMFLLVETIDVGGGTISMIESLARFNTLTQDVDREKKMTVRPYVIMPYLAAVLLVATTVLMLGFTTGGLGAAPTIPGQVAQATTNMSAVTSIFITSVIFNSYIIGIVAGKISEESISAGFKHASILVVVALIAAKIVPTFL